MNILTNNEMYEGWAHTKEEMKKKFNEKFPNEDCEIFLYGNAPKILNLTEYRTACNLFGIFNDDPYKLEWLENLIERIRQ